MIIFPVFMKIWISMKVLHAKTYKASSA